MIIEPDPTPVPTRECWLHELDFGEMFAFRNDISEDPRIYMLLSHVHIPQLHRTSGFLVTDRSGYAQLVPDDTVIRHGKRWVP